MKNRVDCSKPPRPTELNISISHNNESANFSLESTSSSENDYSPASDMSSSSSKKITDKPTFVKRITMGLMKVNDQESRPLVPNRSSPNSPSRRNYFYHYINAGIYDVDNKFGDSCRQSLTSVMDSELPMPLPHSDTNRNTIEFDFKRNIIRETSSANCSPKRFLLSSLKRNDSYNVNQQHIDALEEVELREASWYHDDVSRGMSFEFLAHQAPGEFVVRPNHNKGGSFTLTLRVLGANKIAHYLIVRTPKGYKIKGFHKEFTTLRALITHHSVMKESLPIALALPRPQNIHRKCKNIDDYDTYARLKDLQSIFSDLDISS